MSKKKKKSPYIRMVLSLSDFVIRTAEKENPTSAEVNAMTEAARLLFKTI